MLLYKDLSENSNLAPVVRVVFFLLTLPFLDICGLEYIFMLAVEFKITTNYLLPVTQYVTYHNQPINFKPYLQWDIRFSSLLGGRSYILSYELARACRIPAVCVRAVDCWQ